ncbi:YjiH family protein [Chromohalobacter beijerinckii]|uniref:YjiH family protein n=1 Tax=Chromohalobacter beijerinckii TaxID=86179 RepID=A0ABV8XDZ1_9GAMM|nr:nucleoside recognition domain-containing protein [Chromohalobacter beijerinckii]MCK0766899.1 hypothetical protein [Chromohalobacter beijerinckii]
MVSLLGGRLITMKSLYLETMMENVGRIKSMMPSGIKAILGSLVGVCVFFVPFSTAEGGRDIPLVMAVEKVKSLLGGGLEYVLLISMALLFMTWVCSRCFSHRALASHHGKDGWISGFLFLMALVFSLACIFHIGPEWMLSEDVGGMAIYIAGTVLLTVAIAGFFVYFLTEFGFTEFVGTLMEPLMRPLYKVPGRAAVDAVSSFVASPAVGVYITNKFYKEKKYTQRESASIAANFSVADIGFMAVLASIAGIASYLPQIVVVTFIVTFVVAIVTSRLPPLSNKKDCYIDGEQKEDSRNAEVASGRNIFLRACDAAAERARDAQLKNAIFSFVNSLKFAQKVVAYVVAIATPALALATYTPVMDYLGVLVEPYLTLFNLPDVGAIAPTVLVAITEVALPSIIIASQDVSTMSVFFVCTLSLVQIVFFTESANAMLEADIPLSLVDLILIFIIRTIIAIPLVALAAHIIF